MKNKKLAAIPLIVAIVLSVFGFAYSAWIDTVYIDGTVHMGSLTLAFGNMPPIEPPKCTDYYIDPDTGELVEGEWLGKDVGVCTARYEDRVDDEHTEKYGYKTLIIEVSNAYPQYHVHTTFRLHNIGTVPIDICKYVITGEKREGHDAEGAVVYDLLWDAPDPEYPWRGDLWEDVNGNGIIDDGDLHVINLEITNSVPYQIDPCHDNKAQIDMDFKQDAEECHTYTIHVEVVGIQWNKVAECP